MVNIINMLNHLASKNINPHSQSGTNTKCSEVEGGENSGETLIADSSPEHIFTKNLVIIVITQAIVLVTCTLSGSF